MADYEIAPEPVEQIQEEEAIPEEASFEESAPEEATPEEATPEEATPEEATPEPETAAPEADPEAEPEAVIENGHAEVEEVAEEKVEKTPSKRGRPSKGGSTPSEPKAKKTNTPGSRTSSRVKNMEAGTKLSSEISSDNLQQVKKAEA